METNHLHAQKIKDLFGLINKTYAYYDHLRETTSDLKPKRIYHQLVEFHLDNKKKLVHLFFPSNGVEKEIPAVELDLDELNGISLQAVHHCCFETEIELLSETESMAMLYGSRSEVQAALIKYNTRIRNYMSKVYHLQRYYMKKTV